MRLVKINDLYFRYRRVSDHTIKELLNDEMVLSSADTFNDSHDLSIGYDLETVSKEFDTNEEFIKIMSEETKRTENYYERYKFLKSLKGKHVITEFVNLICSDCIKYLKQKFILGCFADSCNNQAMWSHYADYGKGFVVGYNKTTSCNEFKKSAENITSIFDKVKYTYKVLDASEMIISAIKKSINDGKNFSNIFDLFVKNFAESDEENYEYLLFKNPFWRYERERRVIGFNPYQSKQTHMSVCKIKPSVVILGENISYSNKYLLVSICAHRNIPVYVCECSFKKDKYELYVRPLLPLEISRLLEKSIDTLNLEGLIA